MLQRITMIIVIIISAFGGGYYAYQQLVPPPEQEANAPLYASQPVVKGDISVGVEVTGSLNPSNGGGIRIPGSRNYSSGASSYVIDKILAEEGNTVSQGEVLVKLAAPNLKAKIENAQEELQSVKRSLANLMGVPIEEVDNIDPNSGIVLRAPIEGRIVNLEVKEGDEVRQGQIVARVVDDSHFEVIAKLTPAEFESLDKDQVVVLRFSEYFSQFIPAKIKDINPNPVPESSTELNSDQAPETKVDNYEFVYWVTLEGKNPGLIRPGMPVTIGFLNEKDAGKIDWETLNPTSIKWIRYSSKVDKFVDEEKVLSSADEVIVTECYVHEMEGVKVGDPVMSLAGQDVKDTIQEKLDRIRDKKSELQELMAQKDLLEVKAPMDGVVADIHREQGETVNPGDWIGSIYKTSEMYMWSEVDDVDVLLVKQGSPVQVSVDALPGKDFDGEVERVATRGKGENGITRFEVSIKVKGSPELRPGMQAYAFIKAGDAKDVLLIPLEAIFQEDGQNKVEILTSDRNPKVVTVELGLMNHRVAEVKSGLEEGQQVITGSTADLLPSQKIQSDSLLPGKSNNGDNGDNNGEEGNK